MKYVYHTTYFEVKYEENRVEGILNKGAKLPDAYPIPDTLICNHNYIRHLEEMGKDGWELVSVQPLLRGSYTCTVNQSYGYSLTAGYYLFWKREL